MSLPQTAKLTSTSPIVWSNGATFTGFLLVGMALPNNAQGVQYASVNLFGVNPPQRIPTWTLIPIIQGQFDTSAGLFLSASVEPPSTKYALYWLDSTKTQIFPAVGVPPTLVSVTTDPYVITQPTLTLPAAPTAVPAPQTTFSTPNGGFPPSYVTGVPETLGGTVNGVNCVFTISRNPLLAIIIVDGQIQDQSSYGRVGTTVTFITAPTTGSSVTAYLF